MDYWRNFLSYRFCFWVYLIPLERDCPVLHGSLCVFAEKKRYTLKSLGTY
jgi:hypothetical protein